MAADELLVLWDIDHTLIDAGGLSAHLYGVVLPDLSDTARVLAAVTGRSGADDAGDTEGGRNP